MLCMVVTISVLKLDKSRVVKLSHFSNKEAILVIKCVSKLVTFREVIELQE